MLKNQSFLYFNLLLKGFKMKKLIVLIFLCLITTFLLCGCCIPHSKVIDEAVAPTCTQNGLTEGTHCQKCGKILVEQKNLEALGHKEEILAKGVPATCTSIGATDKTKCTVCKETIEHATIPKSEHIYENNNCIYCGVNNKGIDYNDINIYHSENGYKFLESLRKGDKMCQLYNDIKENAILFHTSKTLNATSLTITKKIFVYHTYIII